MLSANITTMSRLLGPPIQIYLCVEGCIRSFKSKARQGAVAGSSASPLYDLEGTEKWMSRSCERQQLMLLPLLVSILVSEPLSTLLTTYSLSNHDVQDCIRDRRRIGHWARSCTCSESARYADRYRRHQPCRRSRGGQQAAAAVDVGHADQPARNTSPSKWMSRPGSRSWPLSKRPSRSSRDWISSSPMLALPRLLSSRTMVEKVKDS